MRASKGGRLRVGRRVSGRGVAGSEQHRFWSAIDQSYLPPVMRQLEAILERYPVRGKQPR
ncbi:MAG: hypothetical protein N2045_01995 [Fimbriimonadales bacterium]|nr:hypothetical protein [Fimbriimonadales bacterium]